MMFDIYLQQLWTKLGIHLTLLTNEPRCQSSRCLQLNLRIWEWNWRILQGPLYFAMPYPKLWGKKCSETKLSIIILWSLPRRFTQSNFHWGKQVHESLSNLKSRWRVDDIWAKLQHKERGKTWYCCLSDWRSGQGWWR